MNGALRVPRRGEKHAYELPFLAKGATFRILGNRFVTAIFRQAGPDADIPLIL
jgi:hypothetical protein